MTTQITEPTQQATQPSQRQSYMTALSALEQILSASPVLPETAEIRVYSFAPGSPQLMLHCSSAEGVEAFGRFFDAYVTSRPHTGEPDSRIYTSAEGEFLGVPFTAWVLTAAAVSA